MSRKSPIAKRLKEARKEVGLSQKQLGIAAGIDEFVASARMNQYETGKHIPDFDIVQKISKILQVPTAFFYTTDEVLANILKIYAKMSKNNQRAFLKVAEKMI